MSGHPEDTSDKTLFVRGLPYSTTDPELEDVFSDYGPIKTCFTVKNKGTIDKCRGFGYVIFCTRDDAIKALEGVKNISGRKVQVSFANKRPTRRSTKRKKVDVDDEEGEEEGKTSAKKSKLDVSKTGANTAHQKYEKRKDNLAVSVRTSTVVLAGLPIGVTKKQIYKKCRKAGDVTNVTYPVDERSSDTALVQYSNHQVAIKAVSALNGKIFKGSTLSAVLLIKENKKVSKKTLQRSRLIVRNLKFECSEETLHELFSKYGKIIEIKIPTKEDGKRVGCAFVQYSSVFNASHALKQMNGQKIEGRVVAVDWVVPKTQYEEAKLSSVQDSDANDHDEVQSSSSTDEQQSTAEQSDQDQTSVSNVVSEDDITTFSDDAVDKEETMSEQSEDEEESEHECKRNEMEDFTVKEKSHRKKKVTNDVTEGRTVFIRNLSFDTDEDDLHDMFSDFGDISYCKIVVNQHTGLSKGTGFIQFKSDEAAKSCITAANKTDGNDLFLDGRKLNVTIAVSRQDAAKIDTMKDDKRKVDKRNLFLAKEGTMDLQSPDSKTLSKSELMKRQRAASEKKVKLANPNYFVSKTRICIRNLAASVS